MTKVTKYTIDGYDLFDTMQECWAEEACQKLWAAGKAVKTEDGWKFDDDVHIEWWNSYSETCDETDIPADQLFLAVRSAEVLSIDVKDNAIILWF